MTTPPVAAAPRLTSADRYDPALRSFISLEEVRTNVAPGDGDLSGIRVGVKDLIDVRGFATTNGTSDYDERPAQADAPFVAALRDRGAHIVGKTNLNEFAYGVSGYNPHWGTILNPVDRRRTAGGSSGGSAAAVAAGVVDVAIGTDTSGSVRVPAACCGVYGFKLSGGAYPMQGVTPLATSFDSMGYFAADIADLQRVLGIFDLPELRTLRVGRLGHDLETPVLPSEHWLVLREEAWRVHGERLNANPSSYGKDLRWKLKLPFAEMAEVRSSLQRWATHFHRCTEGFDVLLGPALDGSAPTVESALSDYALDEFLVGDRLLRHTPMYNELGWPALVCPTDEGPVQIAARPGDEAKLLAVGASIGLQRDETVVLR
jgi:aspartyl-tRNA(Asn)/glutamyl-tRNA(Gln) amidotransferase subunit A